MVFKGKSMTNSKNMNKLLQFLDLNNFPRMHLSNLIGWEMVAYMHQLTNGQQNQRFGLNS
jgi:hypothetical protein